MFSLQWRKANGRQNGSRACAGRAYETPEQKASALGDQEKLLMLTESTHFELPGIRGARLLE